jgi:prepilin-type N-terminal cleavage/methylation domain-containing protein
MNPKRHPASFTLIEMLVSVAIFSLLVLLLFGLMGGASKLWRRQTAEEESFREARSALNVLSRDMYGALISTNTDWFYCNGTNQLAFLTTLPNTAQGSTDALGDVCAVGYSLEWGPSETGGPNNMSLYRYVCFSTPTYNNYLLAPTFPIENIFVNPDGVNTVRQLIARDIPQVSFTAYTNDSTSTPWMVPTSELSSMGLLSNMTINVGITALNDRMAMQLTTQAQWLTTNSPSILQNEESFTLRVRPQVP